MTFVICFGLYVVVGVFAFRVCIKSMMMSDTVYDWDDNYDVGGVTAISFAAGVVWPVSLVWMGLFRITRKHMKNYQEAGF